MNRGGLIFLGDWTTLSQQSNSPALGGGNLLTDKEIAAKIEEGQRVLESRLRAQASSMAKSNPGSQWQRVAGNWELIWEDPSDTNPMTRQRSVGSIPTVATYDVYGKSVPYNVEIKHGRSIMGSLYDPKVFVSIQGSPSQWIAAIKALVVVGGVAVRSAREVEKMPGGKLYIGVAEFGHDPKEYVKKKADEMSDAMSRAIEKALSRIAEKIKSDPNARMAILAGTGVAAILVLSILAPNN